MNDISKLIQLEFNLKNCENDSELFYSIVNQTIEVIHYEQAVLFGMDYSSKLKVEAISNIVMVDATSPFVQYILDLANSLLNLYPTDEIKLVNQNELSKDIKEQIKEFSPSNIVWIPLKTIKNNIEVEFYLVLFRNEFFEQKDIEFLNYLASSYKYFLFANRKDSFSTKIRNMKIINNKYIKYTALAIFLSMFLPIKMSVVAPCEIQAKNPFVVTSPLDGSIDEIKVNSNDFVQKDQFLVKIKDVDLINSVEIAKKRLDTVLAELHSIKQAGFYDIDKKSQISRLETEVLLKEAELNYSKSLLDKTNIYSNTKGIAIVDNPNEWKGKPVITGEKILLIANPKEVEIKIMLSVKDALFLKENAEVKIFLDNKIFETWDAKISGIFYKPEISPENIVSYKIIADFNDLSQNEEIPKIGLRGTAKIYSENVSLFFYLFRKPITSLRQFIAW
ncbi:HlyD family efflux transporter periplasmic adaptor subunit [Aliarcobacter cryaerophilus]|uniref:HlyD family secretion protein n=1 Tax=Aliarcobacter cryaerophilus TaxID=28198 RepID=A0A2S9TP16_9BACT|nr:HlyD family efflux transporter periplasmic adaptor subunit [Aliarcobacter cryaerophilus]PRN00565.1 HlyD family secretion protein [Arcobacter cryaerophilus gv. pseudocryaerophilus]